MYGIVRQSESGLQQMLWSKGFTERKEEAQALAAHLNSKSSRSVTYAVAELHDTPHPESGRFPSTGYSVEFKPLVSPPHA